MTSTQKKLKVIFVDDEDGNLEIWRARLKSGAPRAGLEMIGNDRDETTEEIQKLVEARAEAREARTVKVVRSASLFNGADLVLIDYDLIELRNSGAITGEDIAYLLRCFSTCGFIVLLNPPDLGTKFFDLRLRRSLDTWADLVLGADQLDNGWLWRGKPQGFAPWSWPNLMDAVNRRERQVRQAKKALERPVFDVLGIPKDIVVAMDHAMTGPVMKKRGEQYTLREFVLDSNHGIHRRDRDSFEDTDDSFIGRIGAARLASWLEHVVLPAQSFLVDAPHLVSRLPGLLKGAPSRKGSWTATATRDKARTDDAVAAKKIGEARFTAGDWLSRPAWYWPLIANHEKYVEWAQVDEIADVVFCEDTSSFVNRSQAHEFMADVPAQFALRYVQNTRPEYRPAVRLSM